MSRRDRVLSTVGLGVFFFGCFWIVANFTARTQRWWNSVGAIFAIFAISATLAGTARPFQSVYRTGVFVITMLPIALVLLVVIAGLMGLAGASSRHLCCSIVRTPECTKSGC